MNPEPPPIADPHSTAPAETEPHLDATKSALCFFGAIFLAMLGAGLFNAGMDERTSIAGTQTRFWLVPLVLATLCFVASLVLWLMLFGIIKREQRRFNPPS